MVTLILTLLCIGVWVYFVVGNIQVRKYQKACFVYETDAIRRLTNSVSDYSDGTGWYLVVLRWNNTGNSTSIRTLAKSGMDAINKVTANTTGEINIDYCVKNVVRLTHINDDRG